MIRRNVKAPGSVGCLASPDSQRFDQRFFGEMERRERERRGEQERDGRSADLVTAGRE